VAFNSTIHTRKNKESGEDRKRRLAWERKDKDSLLVKTKHSMSSKNKGYRGIP